MLRSYSSVPGTLVQHRGTSTQDNRASNIHPVIRIPPRASSLHATSSKAARPRDSLKTASGNQVQSTAQPTKAQSLSALPRHHHPGWWQTPALAEKAVEEEFVSSPTRVVPFDGGPEPGRETPNTSHHVVDFGDAAIPSIITTPPTPGRRPSSPDQTRRRAVSLTFSASSSYGSDSNNPRSPNSPAAGGKSPPFPTDPSIIPELQQGIETLRQRFFRYFSSSSENLMAHWDEPMPRLSLGPPGLLVVAAGTTGDEEEPRRTSTSEATITQYNYGTVIRRPVHKQGSSCQGGVAASNDASEGECTMDSMTAIKSLAFQSDDGRGSGISQASPTQRQPQNMIGGLDGAFEPTEAAAVKPSTGRRGWKSVKRWARTVFCPWRSGKKIMVKKRGRRARWSWRRHQKIAGV